MEIQVKQWPIAQCEPDGKLNPTLQCCWTACDACKRQSYKMRRARTIAAASARILNALYELHSSVFSLEPVTVK